jgi:predicted TIM-barrel fold metal-dependent hydrolase
MKTTIIGWVAASVCASFAPAWSSSGTESFTMADFASVDKVDIHVHINTSDTALIDQAAEDHFRLLAINVDYPDFPPLAEQRRVAHALVAAHPERVAYAAAFSMQGWDEPDWQQHVIQELDSEFAHGAVGVKVWKNIGMGFRDARGKLVMIDDPKFDPVFEFIRQRDKVLIGHQGEPRNCWLPVADMSVNNDKEYFREHPQYHMFLHPEMPSYEDQMAARDRMLDRNPKIKFMGAHMASLEWSVDRVAAFLERYPNAVVDLAARMGQVQFQSNQDRDKVRRFFVRYQERLLYGTDTAQNVDDKNRELRHESHANWLRDWRYLNTEQTFKVPELDAPVHGLGLPKDVIRKIYSANAERWYGDPWHAAESQSAVSSSRESK